MGKGGQNVEEEEYEEYSDEEEFEEVEEGEIEPSSPAPAAAPRAAPAGMGMPGLGMGLPGLRPAGGAAKKPAAPPVEEWAGLQSFPAATQSALHSLLGSLRGMSKNELTILLLGKSGAGKSSTAVSLMGEKVAGINPFQSDTSKPSMISRTAAGFTLNVIDTPSLLEADSVSESALAAISFELRNKTVDAVVFVDRLDVYRCEPLDKVMIEAVSRHFGNHIWDNTIIGLTHGDLRSPPPGSDFPTYVEARANGLRKAIKAAGGNAPLPLALIENSSRCRTNDEGQKVVGPDSTPWLVDLMSKVCRIVTTGQAPFVYDSSVVKRSNPNKKRRWLVPLIFAAQVAFKILVFDRLVEEDAAQGDQYGPYEPEFVEQERERRRAEKEERLEASRQKAQRRKASARSAGIISEPAAGAYNPSATTATTIGTDFDDSDDDEDWD